MCPEVCPQGNQRGCPWGHSVVSLGVAQRIHRWEKTPHVGRPDGWGTVPFVEDGQRRRVLGGAGCNGSGRALRGRYVLWEAAPGWGGG
jgi:hypothetical protein